MTDFSPGPYLHPATWSRPKSGSGIGARPKGNRLPEGGGDESCSPPGTAATGSQADLHGRGPAHRHDAQGCSPQESFRGRVFPDRDFDALVADGEVGEEYSRILEQAVTPAERRLLLAQYARRTEPPDQRVNQAELLDILSEAVNSRNGWKRILARCSN